MKKKLALAFFSTLLAGAALAVSVSLVRSYHPLGGLDPAFSADSARTLAAAVAKDVGIRTEGLETTVDLEKDSDLLRQVYEERGVKEGNRLLRDSIPGYYWSVSWRNKVTLGGDEGRSSSGREKIRTGSSSASAPPGGSPSGEPPEVRFDMRGNLIAFRADIADTGRVDTLTSEEARLIAENAIARFSPRMAEELFPRLTLADLSEARFAFGTEHQFLWKGFEPALRDSIELIMRIAGHRVVSLEYQIQSTPGDRDSVSTYRQIGYAILTVLIAISMVIMAVKRIRAYELGFRMAIGLGVFTAIMMGVWTYVRTSPVFTMQVVWVLFLGPIMVGLLAVLIWSVSESLGREGFREKFVTLDLLANGHLFHSRVGASLLRGISLGACLVLLWLVAIYCVAQLNPIWFSTGGEDSTGLFNQTSIGLALVTGSLWKTLLPFIVFLIFPLSLMRKWMPPVILICVGALINGLATTGLVNPSWAGVLVETAVAAGVVLTFWRFDVFATYVALVTLAVSKMLIVFLASADPALVASGERLLVFGGFTVAVGLVSLLTRDSNLDLDAITPAFSRHITERERLQQELEIARAVQKSLLPKKEPSFAGLDIASRCVPAAEVGGDYYDFVAVSPDRLAVVVGDVSGKGTEGAFYMTLAKGFLKAVARASDSPAKILEEANSLFFENVDRGNFISVVYGIFDRSLKTVTIARAGHNPVIVIRGGTGRTEIVQPSGMALGLEPGEVFGRTIEEVTLTYGDGDLFVFYTDGFGEAANREGEEFGQDRLAGVVRNVAAGSASDVLEAVLSDVRHFVGRAKQRDDMTMVVVKC